MSLALNRIYNMDCLEGMRQIEDKSIDLTVTSPPYDDLREYNGYSFDFENTAKELYRITKDGGVVVWVVGDATHKGSESGTSFKHALYFKEVGFNLHDTMIWNKGGFTAVGAIVSRYAPVFEYMFILSKGTPKTFNPIKDRYNKHEGVKLHGNMRQKDGTTKPVSNPGKIYNKYGIRFNIWNIHPQKHFVEHPAPFPEQLADDHIRSWSDEGEVVFDPFLGSGTTAKMAIVNGRQFIGFEISGEYCDIAEKRIKKAQEQGKLNTWGLAEA
jgi:DNA modification methylase